MRKRLRKRLKLHCRDRLMVDGPCEIVKLPGRDVLVECDYSVSVTIARHVRKAVQFRRPSEDSPRDEA